MTLIRIVPVRFREACDFVTATSLRAAGYRVVAQRPPSPGWDRPSRPRTPTGTEHVQRTLWEADDAA